MTAAELASLLGAKRTSKGKWIAKCPAHDDRTPSLAIAEGRKGIVLKCMSQGCETKEILDALGLTWADLFRGPSTGKIPPRAKLESLQQQASLVSWLLAAEGSKRNYWLTVQRRLVAEMEPLYWEVMPDWDRFSKIRAFELRELRNRRLDWLIERERKDVYCTGISAGSSPQEVRRNSLHGPPPQLLLSWIQAGTKASVQRR